MLDVDTSQTFVAALSLVRHRGLELTRVKGLAAIRDGVREAGGVSNLTTLRMGEIENNFINFLETPLLCPIACR